MMAKLPYCDRCPDFRHIPPGHAKPDDDPLSWYGDDEHWQPDEATLQARSRCGYAQHQSA